MKGVGKSRRGCLRRGRLGAGVFRVACQLLTRMFSPMTQVRKQRLRETVPDQEHPGAWTPIKSVALVAPKPTLLCSRMDEREGGGEAEGVRRRREQLRLRKNPGEVGEDLNSGEPSWNGQGRAAVSDAVGVDSVSFEGGKEPDMNLWERPWENGKRGCMNRIVEKMKNC